MDFLQTIRFGKLKVTTTTVEQIPSVKVKLGNNFVDIRKMTCSQIYWAEIKTISQRPTSYFRWESEYFFATFDWDRINVIPYECASETYLQSLQFIIIHRYFPYKYNLKLWNIEDSSRCINCNQVDTLNCLEYLGIGIGVRSTVVERATHMRVYAGSSPTGADHRKEFISALSFSPNDVK